MQNLGPLSALVLNVTPILSNTGLCPGNAGGGILNLKRDFKTYQHSLHAPASGRSPRHGGAPTKKAGH